MYVCMFVLFDQISKQLNLLFKKARNGLGSMWFGCRTTAAVMLYVGLTAVIVQPNHIEPKPFRAFFLFFVTKKGGATA